MANPIPLHPTRDPRAELRDRLENAPIEHAEALLAGYEVLQALHDQGALEMARGIILSRDRLLEMIVDAAKSPEALRGIRNLILLAKLASAVDLESTPREPLSLLQLARKLNSPNSRRALTALTLSLEAAGKALEMKAGH